MIDTKTLDEFARRLASALPQNIVGFQQDIEKNLRAGVEGLFQKLDLVTREEYEVQVALLARSRERLQLLEQRIDELEKAQGLTQVKHKEE
jgi:BMFP domain-containing protein YqiC